MKQFIQLLSVLSLAVVFGAAAVNAQTSTKIDAAIPFDFSVGGKTISAGTYEFRVTPNSAGGAVVSIIDKNGDTVHTVLSNQSGGAAEAKSELVFETISGGKHLSKVVIGNLGISVPTSRVVKVFTLAANDLENAIVPIASVE